MIMLTLCCHKYGADGVLLQYADDNTLMCSGTYPLTASEVMNQQLQCMTGLYSANATVEISKVKSDVVLCIFEETCVCPEVW